MLEKKLKQETEKWLEKIKEEIKNVELLDVDKENFLNNINAYIQDCEHFLNKNMLVEAFEAVVWAWAWLEILKELKILK